MAKLKIRTNRETRDPRTAVHTESGGVEQQKNNGYTSKYYRELREQLIIDKNNLNECVERQPQLHQEVGEKLSMLTSQRDGKNEELMRLDSMLANEIRDKAARSNQKMTVGEVNDAVMLHPKHTTLQDTYAALKAEADLWQVLRNSFEQRGKMLREEVSLFTTGYFQTGALRGSHGAVRDAEAARARDTLDEKRRSRGS